MERAQPGEMPPAPLTLTLPYRSLLVLCGPAGCGKSTFAKRLVEAHQELKTTVIVSSDQCRALVSDDEANQQVNRDTFDLFHYIIHKRMFQHRFTIADSTALQADARHRLLSLAQRHNYFTSLLIFNISPETCMQRDQSRQRMVGSQVITYHNNLLQQTLQDAPNEGWGQLSIMNEQEMNTGIRLTFSSSDTPLA